jgi:hypothetical protein
VLGGSLGEELLGDRVPMYSALAPAEKYYHQMEVPLCLQSASNPPHSHQRLSAWWHHSVATTSG